MQTPYVNVKRHVTLYKLAICTAAVTVGLAVTLIIRFNIHVATCVQLPDTYQQPRPSQPQPNGRLDIITEGHPSNPWRPLVFNTCLPGMPRAWAPCRASTSRVLGEEVVYPDFKILPPRFIHQDHERQWAQAAERKPPGSTRDALYVPYQNQHGQNCVLLNFTYSGAPHTHWGRGGCMVDEGGVDVASMMKHTVMSAKPVHPSVMFAASPDGHSFQHFLDRVAPMLIQARSLYAHTGTMYMAHRPR